MVYEVILLGAAAAVFALAAVSDARRFIIPNQASVALVVVFAMFALLSPQVLSWPGHVIAGALAFAIGAGLFQAGLMGGGDVKLMAAAVVWSGPALAPGLLAVVALAGGGLALIALAARLWAGSPSPGKLPYGVAIAVGGWWTLAQMVPPIPL